MHDIRFIRENPEGFDQGLVKRGEQTLSHIILGLDENLRHKQTELQELQAKKNEVAKLVGQAKARGEDIAAFLTGADEIKDKIALLEAEQQAIQEDLERYLSILPNIPADDVPLGHDETENVEIRKYGTPPDLSFAAQQHFELGENLKQMDFEQAAKMSGSRFVILKNELARMERALANFMLDIHTEEFGYTEVVPPYLVRDKAMFGVGQLPKFSEDSFETTNGYRLIPTAEVPLTNLVADRIVAEEELPLRFTAYTPCYRSEADSAGKDTRGMIRVHQFSKVELVSIVRPQDSVAEHERMTSAAEEILKRLGLPYRVMLLCTGDMGFSSRKTYDLEVWLPGQNCYREISSCSNCGDFQARRMKARYKEYGSNKNQFVHTLNGSGLAVGRTIVAIMENYQNADGSITIPDQLQKYMNGLKRINIK